MQRTWALLLLGAEAGKGCGEGETKAPITSAVAVYAATIGMTTASSALCHGCPRHRTAMLCLCWYLHDGDQCLSFRVAEESNDEVLRGEMCPAAESVLLSGKSTLLAAQKLNIQPEIQSHKEELIVSAQRVLMETMRVSAMLLCLL